MSYDLIRKEFEDMLEIETSMDNTYEILIEAIKDKKVQLILQKILDDEKKHAENVSEILKILKEE